MSYFDDGKKMKKELSKNNPLKYLLLCVRVILWRTVLSRIYHRRNIPLSVGINLA
jgi:hypothetical protein